MKLLKFILIQSTLIGLLLTISFTAYGQQSAGGMRVVKENLSTFRPESASNSNLAVWKKLNLPAYYNHPDFGQLPFDAPCQECVEILDRRTGDYRYFIDAVDNEKFYIQKSLGFINYNLNNHWISQDLTLKSVTNSIFETRKSGQKVGVDVQNKRTYIETQAGKINFNQWQLIGLNNSAETLIAEANWSVYTVGDNGAKITNIFPNIDAEMIVKNGSVKTNFIIKQNNLGQYDKLVFRDAMTANQPVSFNFQNTSDLISAGNMDVKVGGQNLLKINEGVAYPKNGLKERAIILNYAHRDNLFDVIVPMEWINLNISNGYLIVDPIVTGTATLAQAAILGSMYNASCNFANSCDYPLTIPTPPQAIFTDVRFSASYLAQGMCFLDDGGMRVQIGTCVSPSGPMSYYFCPDLFPGTCTGTDISVFTNVNSCLPAPACVAQNVVMSLKLYRSCKGLAGCSNDCIGADAPFVGVIEGRTLEFTSTVAPITLATTVCQGQALTASTSAFAGVAPLVYSWSFSASGTPSLGSTTSLSINFPTAGPQTVYLTVTDACNNVVTANKVVNVTATPIAVPSSNTPVCSGGLLNLTGNTVAGTPTYAWTGPNGFTSGLQNPTINPVTAAANGTYTYTLSNGGCTSLPVTTSVIITPLPTATAGSNSPICVGGSINLTANTVSGASYTWTGPNGFTSAVQNPIINSINALAAGTYTVTINDAGCISAPGTTVVVVNPVPTAIAGSTSPICAGGTLNLTSNTVAGATYAWTGPNGFTSAMQNPTISGALAAASGTYSLVITNGGCTSVASTVNVVVNPTPIGSPTSNSPVCAGGILNLSGNAIFGASHAWTGPNGFTSASQNPVINPVTAAASGTYTYTITNGGCVSAPVNTTVVINASPTATALSNSPVCVGNSINLTANSIGGATYAWTGPNGFTSALQNPTIPSATATSAGTYSLILTNGGCASAPSTVNVLINPSPTATAGYNAGVCAGGSLNLTSNTVSGATYAWTGPNGFTSSLQNPSINPVTAAAAGTYSLTITNASCVSTPATIAVVISPPPTATASYNVGVCGGGTLTLTSNSVLGASYGWTGPNGFTSSIQNPSINPVTGAAAGVYTLTITVSGCAQATSNVTVVINPGPTATAASNSPICSGATLNLNANAVAGATYAWTGPNGFTSAVQNPTIPAATAAASGSYVLTVTTAGCTAVSSTISVIVTNIPTAIAGSNSPICEGATLNLTGNSVSGATYAWTGPNSYTSSLQSPSIPNTTALNTGTYTLIVTVGACQSAPATTTVAFNPSPIVNVTSTNILCFGGATGSATATPTLPGTYTYAWSPSGGTGAVASNLNVGVYTVVTTNSNGCTSSNSITITQPTEVILNMSSTLTACGMNTGTATVVATGGTGAYTYTWAPSGGNAATATGLAVGSYSVTVTDGSGCVKVGNVNVVSAVPPTITVGNVTNVSCFGLDNGSATISVNGGAPGYTYYWFPSGGSAATASNLAGGQYTVTVTDIIGCSSTEVINITAPAELVVTTSGTGANCGSTDGTATATVTGGTGTYTYTWSPGNLTTPTINNLGTGNYNVVVSDANGCTVSDSYDVTQIGGLVITVNPVSAVIFEDESINLNATLTPYVAGLTYTWTPTNGLSCTDCPNPVATPGTTTVYTVMITTPDGCADSVTSTIYTKIRCGEHFIPTVFSPNGDGQNDIFKVYGKCIVGLDMKIFNRWGEMVFESLDQQNGWNGMHKGEFVSTDSYYYTAKITFQDGTFINEKGSINVVK